MKKKFALTIGAMKDICERCPDHDINQVEKLFSYDDYYTTLDNMVWFILTLNKWAVYRETKSFEGSLTEGDVLSMDMAEINVLFTEAMSAFKSDGTPETEIEPTKKAEAVPKRND